MIQWLGKEAQKSRDWKNLDTIGYSRDGAVEILNILG